MSIGCSWGLSFNFKNVICQSECGNNMKIIKEQEESENLCRQILRQSKEQKLSITAFKQQKQQIINQVQPPVSECSSISYRPQTHINCLYDSQPSYQSQKIFVRKGQPKISIVPHLVEADSDYCLQINPQSNKGLTYNNPSIHQINKLHSQTKHKYRPSDATTNTGDVYESQTNNLRSKQLSVNVDSMKENRTQQQLSFSKPSKTILYNQQIKGHLNQKHYFKQVQSIVGTENNFPSNVIITHNNLNSNNSVPLRQIFNHFKSKTE